MADTRKLIETILSSAKLADRGNIASRVYRDEPLLMTAAQLERFTPSQYREMRKIARGGGIYSESEAKIFYKQGKFMEDFEDDFDYPGEFVRYFPTYQAMNDQQLRGYFSWRTKVRRGIVEKTSLSFAFVYIYELLHQIGVRSPVEGFQALQTFWTAYRKFDAKIDGYLRLWLRDYVVYNNLDKSLLDDFSDVNFDNNILTLLNHKTHDAEAVFSALNALSSYALEDSRFFRLYPEDVKAVVYGVFTALSEHHDKNNKNSLCERFFGSVQASPYAMFRAAVFYHGTIHDDVVYEINDSYKYRCIHGNWICERFFRYGGKNKPIGALLKNIDFCMRREYGYKSSLKAEKLTKILQDIISREIDRVQERQKQAASPTITIDVSKLQHIRNAALETQNKLLVAEEEAADTLEISPAQAGSGNNTGLSDTEYTFMQCLLYGRTYDDLIRSQGLMLSVLMDAINEKLFDLFGDTVIVEDSGKPALLEDYADALKGMIKE